MGPFVWLLSLGILLAHSSTAFAAQVQDDTNSKGYCARLLHARPDAPQDYAKAIRRLGIKFEQQNDAPASSGGLKHKETLPLVLSIYGDFFYQVPQAKKLLEILVSTDPTTMKNRLDRWVLKNITEPNGYVVLGPKEIEKKIANDRQLSELGQVDNTGFIMTPLYMALLEKRIIPLGNDHDIMIHLPLFSLPDVAALTHQMAKTYVQASRLAERDLRTATQDICESIWQGIQERTAFLTKGPNGKIRFAVVGGYTHVFAWRWRKPEDFYLSFAKKSLFPYPSPDDRLGSGFNLLYSKLQKEMRSKSPSSQARALNQLFVNELGLRPNYKAIIAESKKFDKMLEKFIPMVHEGRIEEAMTELGQEITQSKSKLIQMLFDHSQSIRFWTLHLDYLRSLIKP